jgi:hypothetical protein
MPKKKGTLNITPEKRLKWLKQFEKGESYFQIASQEGVDHRTVSKQVAIAKSESELKDERGAVLRGALERHFADLLSIVETTLFCIDSVRKIEFSGENEFLQNALHDHIPRSPIWKLVRRWNSGVADLNQLETLIWRKLESRLTSDTDLSKINKHTGGELFKRLRQALKYNPKERSQVQPELDVDSLEKEVRLRLLSAINAAVSGFLDLDKKESVIVQKVLSQIDNEMETWEEINKLPDIYRTLADTKSKLKKNLLILKWKRIIPGRCPICPI